MGSRPASQNPLTFIAHRNKEWSKNATELARLVIFLANALQQEKAKTCGFLSDPQKLLFQLCVSGVELTPCLLFQYCVCIDDCSSSNCMCGQLSMRCWYDKVRTLNLLLG